MKQCTIINSLTTLSQRSLDEYIINYVIDAVLPIHHVDTPAFHTFVQKLTSGQLVPRPRQTVMAQIEKKFIERKTDLKGLLQQVKTVCTTADCWTSRRRSFMGVTVHWIEAESLKRKGACLAVRQLSGSHTYDIIAKMLESIHDEFAITDKVCFTVTDSGSNFLKAFKHFGLDKSEEIEEELNDENAMDYDFIIDNVFNQVNFTSSDDDRIVYKLPPHWKCACHQLSLIATVDASKFEDSILKKVSVQVFSKLYYIWNKQNRSSTVAEKIKEAFGFLLPTPGDTRWNSVFDAVSKITSILSSAETETKFDKLCDELDVKRLQPIQKTFVLEYVLVMKPLCCALDILQGDKSIGLGYLLPTINILNQQLDDLQASHPPLVICNPLIVALKCGINKRFQHLTTNIDAQLAAAVNPRFKLDWMTTDNHKQELTAILKRRVRAVFAKDIKVDGSVSSTECSQLDVPDFFGTILAARKQRIANASDDAAGEVDRYLNDSSSDLTSLVLYPHIKSLYVTLNTGLPASAAVERLFSLSGRVFSPLRNRLTAEHLEMMTFLRLAKW